MTQLGLSPLQQFAEQVLFGTTLGAKLSPPPPSLFEEVPQKCSSSTFLVPTVPGRPQELQFEIISKKSSKHAFPSKASFDQDASRGMVLHFFANHELLALEIMALALLKFPNAPWPFLRGIIQTMSEEQRHMRLYLDRMTSLGVQFGQAPLNGFFWRSLKDIDSPQAYAAAMSLTFEQANLDFALHFEHEFRSVGDTETANILSVVRQEEIGHVKHGVVWLERWHDPAKNLWDEYLTHIRFPMTPMRAKGPTFDVEGRRAAGLTENFIAELRAFSSSRGRPPNVFYFNPSCEEEVRAGKRGFSPTKTVTQIAEDMASLMMFVASSDDVVLGAKRPTVQWATAMRAAGFSVPEFIELDQLTSPAFRQRKLGRFEPWGFSPESDYIAQCLAKIQVKALMNPVKPLWPERPYTSNIFSKSFAAHLRGPQDLPGLVCFSQDEIFTSVHDLFAAGASKIVVKSPLSSSGRHTQMIVPQVAVTDNQRRWLDTQLSLLGHVVVEPWVDRLADLSLQFYISPSGQTTLLGHTRFIVNPRGQYRGHLFGKLLSGLPAEAAEEWHRPGGWKSRFEETALRVGGALAGKGFHGPVGIDGFIYKDFGKSLQFQSLSEINPRFTMGRIALALNEHVVAKTPGIWLHLSIDEMVAAGFSSSADFARHCEQKAPLVVRRFSTKNSQLSSGILFTNDPGLAKQTLTMLVLGPTQTDLSLTLAELNLHDICHLLPA